MAHCPGPQPADHQPAPAAFAADEQLLPLEFSVRLSCGWRAEEGTRELEIQPLAEGALVREERRGNVARPLVLEMGDPWFDGRIELRLVLDAHDRPGRREAYAGLTALWEGTYIPGRCSWEIRGLVTRASIRRPIDPLPAPSGAPPFASCASGQRCRPATAQSARRP